MTNEEIVARALYENAGWRTPWDDQIDSFKSEYIASAGRVVAALTEAGRLVPDGCVAIERGRWERVRRYAEMMSSDARCVDMTGRAIEASEAIEEGDLDASET